MGVVTSITGPTTPRTNASLVNAVFFFVAYNWLGVSSHSTALRQGRFDLHLNYMFRG